MAEVDEMFYRMIKRTAKVIESILENYEKSEDWLERYREEMVDKVMELANTTSSKVPALPKTPSRNTKSKRPAQSSCTSNDEDNTTRLNNQTANVGNSFINTTCGRSQRNASKLAEQKIAVQAQVTLKTKLRRPGKDGTTLCDISNNATMLTIKSEKQSYSPLKELAPPIEPENIKKENMPPPTAKPKRGRKKIKKEIDSSDTESDCGRSTRSKKAAVKPSAVTNRSTRTKKKNRDSDVIVQEVPIPTIVLDSDTDDTDTQQNSKADLPVRTRTKPKKAARSKKTTKKNVAKTSLEDDSLYEDALATIHKEDAVKNIEINNCVVVLENIGLNSTHTIQTDRKYSTLSTNIDELCQALNETRVLSKDDKTNKTDDTPDEIGPWRKANILPQNESILTEDDSIFQTTPEKKPSPPRKAIKNKQMFSPNSPVRKRVAAFEKLVNEVEIPTKVTRIRTRNQNNIEATISKTKTKYFTPVTSNKMPSLIPQSDTRFNRQATIANKNTTVSTKSATAVKPSKEDLQLRKEEEQRKRLEKAEEVRKKKEAIIQARAEEQRKKREEKQLKAQKLREELEREKEEKLKQQLMNKDQERKKHAETLAEIEEKKRAEAERAKLLKLCEQQEKLKQIEEKRKKQLAVSKPPPLPVDIEDSDNENASAARKNYVKPAWAQSHNMKKVLKSQLRAPKFAIAALFQMGAQTPNLGEIFDTMDERLLKRNSSAVWRTPPRYSTLPKF